MVKIDTDRVYRTIGELQIICAQVSTFVRISAPLYITQEERVIGPITYARQMVQVPIPTEWNDRVDALIQLRNELNGMISILQRFVTDQITSEYTDTEAVFPLRLLLEEQVRKEGEQRSE